MLKQKPYNFATNTLKAYLSAQLPSLSAFVIWKTHIVAQKPRGKQLNAKMWDSKSAIGAYHSIGALWPLSVFITSNSPWSIKMFTALLSVA